MSHILIAGLGDLGAGLAEQLIADGHRISAIRRGAQAPALATKRTAHPQKWR